MSNRTLKAGTRIELLGTPQIGVFSKVAPERGVICRRRVGEGGPPHLGWYIVRFDSDGGRPCVHESRFRIINNREAS
jgi:hypothetical protein